MSGKVDYLLGLKENVIIGHLIPAGTGIERYRDLKVVFEDEDEEEAMAAEAEGKPTSAADIFNKNS